ncbi:uncharacterized protein B0I36DRAFT_1514 [Microdochium trichocladiopsis]|uniref:Transcription factor domain-containing protein n=1 Tax=Microdochium trichocladiopsis TaxID=1682393 RepID=A0A9P9BZ44_9PEZI|nr:uncharacterized protein B0I36DRAFT_1514 [Microdochium trichocladiopsis]KAH7039719.1 hypothetical protein B0I36DRAFT_1514 [Microdochium trichocladiopsis]
MDHFNATVFDGHMVATRRGFQVTKQKHHGLAFVNTSAQHTPAPSKQSKKAAPVSLPLPKAPLIFITNEEDEKKHTARLRKERNSRPKSQAPACTSSTRSSTPKRRSQCSRLHSPSSVSSASSRLSSRGSFSSADDASDTSTDRSSNPDTEHYPAPLPAWAKYKQPQTLHGSYRKLLFMCHAFPPNHSNPLASIDGASPSLSPENFICAAQDPTAIHCGITLGTLYDAVCSGNRSSPYLDTLTLQLCSIINRRLNKGEQASESRSKTVHAVATLAILASYARKWDHWDVHMKGLLHLLNLGGAQHELDMHTISTIRKADFCGAVAAATSPYIPFIRRHVPLRYPNHVFDHDAVTGRLVRHLSSIGLETDLITTIADVAALNKCLTLSTATKDTFAFDSEAALEHYYNLGYKLLSTGGPLRFLDGSSSTLPPREHSIMISFQQYITSIKCAIRIIVLVYLQNPAFDLANDEGSLFELLHLHLAAVLSYLRSQQSSHLDQDPFNFLVDPTIRDSHGASLEAHRPVLLWLCLAGHILQRNSEVTRAGSEGKVEMELMGKQSIYKDLLQEVLGPVAAVDPGLVSDYELEVCKCLDLRVVLDPSHPMAQEGGDERGLMRFMLGVFKLEYSLS